MKKRLTVIFILIILSILGIIHFQGFWLYKSYQVNESQLADSVRIAFTRAQNHCGQDYRDSLKNLFIRQLTTAKYDVNIQARFDSLRISFTRKDSVKGSKTYKSVKGQIFMPEFKFTTSVAEINIDIRGTGFDGATSNEHAFLLNKVQYALFGDSTRQPDGLQGRAFLKSAEKIILTKEELAADSIKLASYFEEELERVNIYSPFQIRLTTEPDIQAFFKNNPVPENHIETGMRSYKFHYLASYGFGETDLHVGANVFNPERAVLMQMWWILLSSALLIISMVFCYVYLLRMILKQKRLADMKDDFINNMTHEFKTPIATISAAVEGMQSFNALQNKDKTERYLETSRKELNRLNNLVTKVLNMAGYEKKEIELLIKELSVNDLINEIIAAEKFNSTKTIHFIFNNPDAVNQIKADPVHFRNALANLVDNAVKYSGDPVDLAISCYKDEKFVYFSVKDNGIGIPPSQIKRIFDKFHRVPTGNIHSVKGTGLGLSYVKYVIEAHGGTVTVKSEPGKGSAFTISLPI